VVLAAVACVAAALLVGAVVERVRADGWGLGLRPEMLLFGVATVLGTVLEVGQGRDVYDRYLIPLALPVLAILMSGPLPELRGRRRIASIVVAFGMLVLTDLALTANAFAFDAAVWRTASRVVESDRADAQHVDAGLAWDGYHASAAMSDLPDRSVQGLIIFDVRPYLPDPVPCYVVSPSPRTKPGSSLVSVQHYKTYGAFGDAALYVIRIGGSQSCS
jgi:hypothetical protein